MSKATYAILKIADSAINASKGKQDRKKAIKNIIKNATKAQEGANFENIIPGANVYWQKYFLGTT